MDLFENMPTVSNYDKMFANVLRCKEVPDMTEAKYALELLHDDIEDLKALCHALNLSSNLRRLRRK